MLSPVHFQGVYALQGKPDTVYQAYGLIQQQGNGHNAPLARFTSIETYSPYKQNADALDTVLDGKTLDTTTLYVFTQNDAQTLRRNQEKLTSRLKPLTDALMAIYKESKKLEKTDPQKAEQLQTQATEEYLSKTKPASDVFDRYITRAQGRAKTVDADQAIELLEAKRFNLVTGGELSELAITRFNNHMRRLHAQSQAEKAARAAQPPEAL